MFGVDGDIRMEHAWLADSMVPFPALVDPAFTGGLGEAGLSSSCGGQGPRA